MTLLAGILDTVQLVGIAVGALGAAVALIVVVRVGLKKGTGEAEKAAADAWKSLAEAHAAEILELRGLLARQQGKIDEQRHEIDILKTEVRQLSALPDYSELVAIVKDMVAMERKSAENEQTILATLASSVENEQTIRAHAHEIKGSLEGIAKIVTDIHQTVRHS